MPPPLTRGRAAGSNDGAMILRRLLAFAVLGVVLVLGPMAFSSPPDQLWLGGDRKSTRLNSSHGYISYAVFCLKKKKPFRTVPDIARSIHARRGGQIFDFTCT